jgi:hypothetical protein
MKKASKKEVEARNLFGLKIGIGVTAIPYRRQVWSVLHVTPYEMLTIAHSTPTDKECADCTDALRIC